MKKHMSVAIVGGDARQAILAELMDRDGHTVSAGALERHSFEHQPSIRILSDLKAGLPEQSIIILPMPVQKGEDRLNAPLANAPWALSELLDSIAPGTLVLAGAVPFAVHARAVRNRLRLLDYLKRDELAIRNAVPAAFTVSLRPGESQTARPGTGGFPGQAGGYAAMPRGEKTT